MLGPSVGDCSQLTEGNRHFPLFYAILTKRATLNSPSQKRH
jgi:hypothetical protein